MNLESSLMNDITPGDTNNTKVLRILNGVLKGCEFQLPIGKTLVLVGDKSTDNDQSQALNIPENAIYVPAMEGANSFEIWIDDSANIKLRILDQENSQEISYQSNTVYASGTLSFAVKSANEDWSEAVLNPTTAEKFATSRSTQKIKSKSPILVIIGIVLALIIGTFGYQWIANSKPHVDKLSVLLQGSSEKLDIYEGHDHVLYVFANSERDASWAKQILIRSHFKQAVKVITYQEEESNIAKKIENDYPNLVYHTIRLSPANKPQIFFSATRTTLPQAYLTQLSKRLEKYLPYADKIEFISIADQDVVNQANSGLDKLGIQYVRSDHTNSVTFLIQGNIEDSNLQRVRNFVDDFNKQWGKRYVQFSIELQDDAFKGKSFMYNNHSSGYVKLTPSHWYFLQAH